MGSPAQRDLTLYRGDDYAHEITFTDDADPPVALDLTGYTFKAQIRDRDGGGSRVYGEFTIDDTDAATGKIVLHMASAATRFSGGYWDLQVDDGSTIQTWLKGRINTSGDVTQ